MLFCHVHLFLLYILSNRVRLFSERVLVDASSVYICCAEAWTSLGALTRWSQQPSGWMLVVLHCTALHCTPSHYTVPIQCIKLHCTVLYWATQHRTILSCAALHCTMIRRIVTNHILWFRSNGKFWGTINNKTVLHYIIVYCTALHCTALHCTALNCSVQLAVFKLRQLLRYFLVTTIGDDPGWTSHCTTTRHWRYYVTMSILHC